MSNTNNLTISVKANTPYTLA